MKEQREARIHAKLRDRKARTDAKLNDRKEKERGEDKEDKYRRNVRIKRRFKEVRGSQREKAMD